MILICLANLIKANTYFKSPNQTSTDVTLTNGPRSSQKSGVITTGLSDCHKITLTFFRSYFSSLPPKTITYRRFSYFKLKISYTNWKTSYAVKSVMEGLNMMT